MHSRAQGRGATQRDQPPEECAATPSWRWLPELPAGSPKAAPQLLRDLFVDLETYIESLGDDVTKKTLKNYFAYRRIKNFACVEVHPNSGQLLVYLKVNPDSISLKEGLTRDVRKIGHFGTGELEVRLKSLVDLDQVKPLIQRSYDGS